jgi:hypothetical protein
MAIELISELKAALTEVKLSEGKSWIKGDEVKKLLNLSEIKLQKLRIQGMFILQKLEAFTITG